MISQWVIRAIGLSHLLQPPLTLLLGRRLELKRAFSTLPPLPAHVARNMAFASVAFPTCAGLLIAFGADDVVSGGPLRYAAWTMAAFWTWRLWRQHALRRLLPTAWHFTLSAIFCVQGPMLGLCLLWSATAPHAASPELRRASETSVARGRPSRRADGYAD